MNLPLIDQTLDEAKTTTAVENEIIQEAMQILDRRLFTRDAEIPSSEAAASYLKFKLASEENEVFAVIFLDTKHQTLAFEVLFQGTVDSAVIYPRQIVRRALAHNAAAAIISHNHPSGSSEPSMADIALTRRIKEALQLINVRLVDHFIVGSGIPLSMAEKGLV
ncbi:DNA repair protein RadC [Pseudomonas sp. Pseusp122]